jgi:hypothetical protein
MSAGSHWLGSTRLLFALTVLAGVLLGAWAWRSGQKKRAAEPAIDDWDVSRLARHLNDRGLGLRVLSTSATYDTPDSVYLTTTDLNFEQLDVLPKSVKVSRAPWKGSLFCQRMSNPEKREWFARTWEDEDGLPIVGPFVFFGDPELLRRVRAALADAP